MKAAEIQNIIKVQPETVFHGAGYSFSHGIIRGFVNEKSDRWASTTSKYALVHYVRHDGSVSIKPTRVLLRQIERATDPNILSFMARIAAEQAEFNARQAKAQARRERMTAVTGDWDNMTLRYEALDKIAAAYGVTRHAVTFVGDEAKITIRLSLEEIEAIVAS